MRIIPVIDLKAGRVVHARRGDRANYLPIVSPLCRSSSPPDVVAGLLDVYPFEILYIADLSAIQGEGRHDADIADLQRRFPQLQLWVDCGLADDRACRDWLERNAGTLVIGSEAMDDPELLRRLHDVSEDRLALSLDFRNDGFLGPARLLAEPDLWPSRVIVMTLSRVGSDAGPDFVRLDEIRNRAGSREVFAAGGVRGGEDLSVLARRGLAGVLVASALHDRRIGRAEIAAVETPPAD